MLIMGFMSGSFLGQQMQFLELVPTYLCADNELFANEYTCTPLDTEGGVKGWCNNPLIAFHRVDYTDILSLHNWIVDLKPDLACMDRGFTSPIGILGSMQFVGWAISAAIVPRLSDFYGRRLIFLGSMLLQLAALIGIYFSRYVSLTTGLIFFFGMGGVGRSSISYLYMQEFLPSSKSVMVGTILQLNNGFIAVYTVLYYWFISQYWIPL
jgi:MFS family permease